MKKTRVLIVEDSAVVTALLAWIIGRDPRLEVCGTAANAEDALQRLDHFSPDVIAMDMRLPGIDGIEATRRIMSKKPVPIVVVTASVHSGQWDRTVMEALRAGALTVIEKPPGTDNADYAAMAERLCTQLFIMSQVKLVRQHRGDHFHSVNGRVPRVLNNLDRSGGYKMLGIASSTGGPGALVQILGDLGPAFPLPILLVQHMTANFLDAFASWLGSVCPCPVILVNDGAVPVAGTVHMAPPGRHLRLDGGRLWLDGGAPISFQRPSGTVLFESMARDLGRHALAALLTGMGEDGASGLLDIRRSGGYTIAEDESTAVVYGMPAAAVRMGAVCESLPLPAIAPRFLELVPCTHS
jgi:two-component system, chemotaxis family, protein-glutamate methylesterase/glutaminase